MGGLVRVSVSSGPGPALDLAVPGHLAVADLLPEIVRLGGAAPGPTGLRLVTAAGAEVAPDASLLDQGVADGAVLALVDGPAPPRRDDDPAAELARTVSEDVLAWDARLTRPVGLLVGLLLFAVSGAALARGPSWSGAVAAAAVVLTSAVAAAAGRRHDRLVAATGGWLAVGFAAVAGAQSAGPVAAGASATVVALGLCWILGPAWVLLAPAAVASGVLGGLAVLAQVGRVEHGLVAAVALATVGLASPGLPRLALAITRDRPAVARDLLRASLAASAVLMTVLAALATRSGAAGAGLAVVIALFTAARASRHHGAVEILTGLATATSILLVAGVAQVVHRPDWAGHLGAGMLALGALAALVSVAPRFTDPRWAVALDRIEVVLLLAVVPLVVVASGAIGLVRVVG